MASSLFGNSGNPYRNQLPQNATGSMSRLQQIKMLMSTIQGSQNPQQMLSMMALQNPQLSNVMSLVQNHNGNAKDAFYALAKDKGVDPNEIINALK